MTDIFQIINRDSSYRKCLIEIFPNFKGVLNPIFKMHLLFLGANAASKLGGGLMKGMGGFMGGGKSSFGGFF